MNTLTKAAEVRRAVENMAYKILEKSPEPEIKYDGHDYYTEEYWEIDPIHLHEAVNVHLLERDIHPTNKQISFYIDRFLKSEEYEVMQEQVREDYYESEYFG